MWVNEDKLIALAHNLGVETRDNPVFDYNIIRRVSPNIDDILIERIRMLLNGGVVGHF